MTRTALGLVVFLVALSALGWVVSRNDAPPLDPSCTGLACPR